MLASDLKPGDLFVIRRRQYRLCRMESQEGIVAIGGGIPDRNFLVITEIARMVNGEWIFEAFGTDIRKTARVKPATVQIAF